MDTEAAGVGLNGMRPTRRLGGGCAIWLAKEVAFYETRSRSSVILIPETESVDDVS